MSKSVLGSLAKIAASVAVFSLTALQPARAQVEIIDPNFSVCAYGTTNVSSCGTTDPQIVTSAGVSVGVIGSGGMGLLNPFLLFVAVPDLPNPPYPGSPAPAPTPGSSASLNITLATSAMYGQTNAPVNGYLGEMTSSSSDLYTLAGLVGGNNSMNFTNMGGYSGYSTKPTSFSIYEFVVTVNGTPTGSALADGSVFDLPFTSLGFGSIVAAWGLDQYPLPDKGTVTVYATPWTTAGFVSSSGGSSSSSSSSGGGESSSSGIPEPGTSALALLGLGLLAGSFVLRKARQG